MKDNSTEIFKRNWRIYQTITLNNYMFHHDFSLFLSPVLKDLSNRSSIDVLDCGCGDAYLLSNQLKGLPVFSFTGYDMSNQALDAARNNLGKLECEIILKQGPMEKSIQSEEKEFDVIYSSFLFIIYKMQTKENCSIIFTRSLKKMAFSYSLIYLGINPFQEKIIWKNIFSTSLKNGLK